MKDGLFFGAFWLVYVDLDFDILDKAGASVYLDFCDHDRRDSNCPVGLVYLDRKGIVVTAVEGIVARDIGGVLEVLRGKKEVLIVQ